MKSFPACLGAVSPASATETSCQTQHSSSFGANTRGKRACGARGTCAKPGLCGVGHNEDETRYVRRRRLIETCGEASSGSFIPAAPEDEAQSKRSRCLCDLGRADCGREVKKSATCRLWHLVAPQEGGAGPEHREDSGSDVWAVRDTAICQWQYAVTGQRCKIWDCESGSGSGSGSGSCDRCGFREQLRAHTRQDGTSRKRKMTAYTALLVCALACL